MAQGTNGAWLALGVAGAVAAADAVMGGKGSKNGRQQLQRKGAGSAAHGDSFGDMNRYVVTATRTPTNYNQPTSYIVEAATENDARAILKDNLRDLGPYPIYVYSVKPYTPPPAGRVVGMAGAVAAADVALGGRGSRAVKLKPLLGLGSGTSKLDTAYERGYELKPALKRYSKAEHEAWESGRQDGLSWERERRAMRGY